LGANNQRLEGGEKEALLSLCFRGIDSCSQKESELRIPTWVYEADIREDFILSYPWCRRRNMDILARKHGLSCKRGGKEYWIPGIKSEVSTSHIHVTATERPKRALDLFSGTGSASKVLQAHGYEVISVDLDARFHPTICADIDRWDYKIFPAHSFDVIMASPPCTEFSVAKTRGERDIEGALALVSRTIEIVQYFDPPVWWLETPRYGYLGRGDFLKQYAQWDCDYCQFTTCGFKKPTRFFGSDHLRALPPILCDGVSCQNLGGGKKHLKALGGNTGAARRTLTYPIPWRVVECASGLLSSSLLGRRVRFADEKGGAPLDKTTLLAVVEGEEMPDAPPDELPGYGQEKACVAREPETHALAEEGRKLLLEKYSGSVLSGKYIPDPPKRGPFGEAEIWVKPDATPVAIRPYRVGGEKLEAYTKLLKECVDTRKIVPSMGSWNLPTFVVPKPNGKFRLVQDFRPLNVVTVKDGHPLPRILDILQRQGLCKMWSKLDLVDGFHQMPLRKDHRHYTCTSTPWGVMEWTVLSMGLKNAGSQFQRMMEGVLQGLSNVDVYLDDILIGSVGNTLEELISNHRQDVERVLDRLTQNQMVCSPAKSKFFQREVEILGHVLRDGIRKPAPGKLLPIEKWELPRTITALRSFLGVANYLSEYVPQFAKTAAPLMEKLKVSKEEGKRGSLKEVSWSESDIEAFHELKRKLVEGLSLYQPKLDQPFVLKTDASERAIGAELSQYFDGVLRPVAFFSRKLAQSQLNWAIKEKEMYAVVSALHKWSGLINFQPVLIQTDHKALENWVTEHVETPSGPSGRRGRWHQILSQFDLEIQYIPASQNLVADCMSRWAYPATSSRQDVSWHGSLEAKKEVAEMIAREKNEGRTVCIARFSARTLSFALERPQDEAPGMYIRPVGARKFKFWQDMTEEERRESKEFFRRYYNRPFARDPPGEEIPETQGVEGPLETPAGDQAIAPPNPLPRRPEVGSESTQFVLDENWAQAYQDSETFCGWWDKCHSRTSAWPMGVQLFRQKLSVESFVFQKRKWRPLYLLSTWRQDTPESRGFARQPKASFYFQRQGIFLTL
jgi:hypothetical protein